MLISVDREKVISLVLSTASGIVMITLLIEYFSALSILENLYKKVPEVFIRQKDLAVSALFHNFLFKIEGGKLNQKS